MWEIDMDDYVIRRMNWYVHDNPLDSADSRLLLLGLHSFSLYSSMHYIYCNIINVVEKKLVA